MNRYGELSLPLDFHVFNGSEILFHTEKLSMILPSLGTMGKQDCLSDSKGSASSVLDFDTVCAQGVTPPDEVWFRAATSTINTISECDDESDSNIDDRGAIFPEILSRCDKTQTHKSISTSPLPSLGLKSNNGTRIGNMQKLQNIASKLERFDDLTEASKYFKVAMYLALQESSSITIESCAEGGRVYVTNEVIRHQLQEKMVRVTILISFLRCLMASKYTQVGDMVRAIACCSGARNVLDRPDVIRYTERVTDTKIPLSGLVQVMLESIMLAESCLQDRRRILQKIEELRYASAIAKTKLSMNEHLNSSAPVAVEVDNAENVSTLSKQLLTALAIEQQGRGTATKYLEDAVLIYKVSAGDIRPNTGRAYSLLARVYRCQKLENQTLHHFEAAADMFSKNNNRRELGSTLNDIAVLRMRRGEIGLAVQLLSASLRSFELLSVSGCGANSWMTLDSLQSLRNLGDCCAQEKEYSCAQNAFIRALNLQCSARKVLKAVKSNNLGVVGVEPKILCLIDDENTADTFVRLGNAYMAEGKHEKALEVFHVGLEEISDLHNKHSLRSLIRILYVAAGANVAIGQYDTAIALYKKAMNVQRKISEIQNEQGDGMVIAGCCLGIANVHIRKLQYTEAHTKFSEAICYCEKLGGEGNYEIADYLGVKLFEIRDKITLVGSMTNITSSAELEDKADVEQRNGNLDHAILTLTEALKTRKKILARLKEAGLDTSGEVHALVHLLQRFGSVFSRKGDDTNAERAFRHAKKLFHRCSTHASNEIPFQTGLKIGFPSLNFYITGMDT